MNSKILLVTALYLEAKPFIQELNLKPVQTRSNFQIFANDSYELIVTGTGKVAGSSGTTFLINNCVQEIKVIANIGLCGAKNEEIGSLFLIDQIYDEGNKRSFYPDIFYNTDIPRRTIHTLDMPDTEQLFPDLVDMEASGFFEAASHFLTSEKIQVLKIVSDHANQQKLNILKTQQLLKANVLKILEYINAFDVNLKLEFSEEEIIGMERLFRAVHFTKTQHIECKKLLWNLKIQGEDILQICENSQEHTAPSLGNKLRSTLKNY